jgi:hypothetical protein
VGGDLEAGDIIFLVVVIVILGLFASSAMVGMCQSQCQCHLRLHLLNE